MVTLWKNLKPLSHTNNINSNNSNLFNSQPLTQSQLFSNNRNNTTNDNNRPIISNNTFVPSIDNQKIEKVILPNFNDGNSNNINNVSGNYNIF